MYSTYTLNMPDSTFLQFECDACGKDHDVEVDHNSEPNDTWPLGWILLRTRAIGLSTDVDKAFCCSCRGPLLAAMGFTSYKDYVAVVKATVEMEQRHVQERMLAAHGTVMTTVPSLDPKNLN